MTASTDTFNIIETIDDRTGGKNRPVLIASSSRRKQCPLPPPHPAKGCVGSCFLDRAGSDRCIKGWSRRTMQSPQCKPIDSTRIGTGQSRFRGRVRCLNHLIAWQRRRREPGSNSVIITIALTRDEGFVVGRGGLQRVRKIFAGCPAIRPIWDQSPGRTASPFETVGNRLYPLHDQDCLRRFTAEAQIQDRSRDKTGPNTAPAFSRVYNIPSPSMGEGQGEGDTADPTVIPAQAGTHRKTKHAIYPLSRSEGGAGAQTTANRQRGMPPKPAPVPRYGGGNPPPPSLPIIKFSAISGSGNSRKYH